MKFGIIITGLINDYFVDELIEQYNNFPYDKIISTWKTIDSVLINKLKDNNFIVVQNDFDKKILANSVNYQNFHSMKGIEFAETLDITHVLRVRADMYCSNIKRLIEIYKEIYEENKLIFLCKFYNYVKGYLIDYAHFGNIRDTKKYICNFQSNNDTRFTELFRQDMCFETNDFNIIDKRVIYSGKKLLDENIDFVFLKHPYREYGKLIKGYVDYNTSNGFCSF
jgi:hypothetical protein